MSFYLFRLETISVKHKRGNIPDDDFISFSVIINQVDRGHGAALFPAMTDNSVATTDDITEDGLLAYPATKRVNMSERWEIGPLETAPTDDITVVYTGTNISDASLSSIDTQKQDDLEIKILNVVLKKFVGLVAGVELGEEAASAFSEAFDDAFKDPVGDLVGYQQQGPCNGPVFADANWFKGSKLDLLPLGPLTYTLYPGTAYPLTVTSTYPGIRFTQHCTDERTHDTGICGPIAETDVTFSVLRVPFISVNTWATARFPDAILSEGLRKLAPSRTAFSVKSLLGVKP